MSLCLSSKDGVIARKRYRCTFCFEPILTGEKYDKRTGVTDGEMFTMHMHPECHAYEDEALTEEDYEDMSDPVFTREDALAFAIKKSSPADAAKQENKP